jgi:hypothetical protein
VPRVFTAGLLLFVLVFVAFELSINSVWATDHATSFVQLDYSVWHDHSFALTSATKIPPWSVDDFVYRGQNYSALAPGAAFLALPFTGAGFAIAGRYTAYGPVLTLSETFVALTGALAAYLVYRLASFYFRRSTSLFLGFSFAFSTIAWPMATYFFQSDPSALFVLLTVYLGIRVLRHDGPASGLAFLSGLAAGVAVTVDYVNGVLLPIVFVSFLLGKRKFEGSTSASGAAFVLGALPGLAALGYYNYAIFGNPLVGTEQSYLHSSSVFGSFTTSPLYGLALDLVSPARGLFLFAPVLLLGLIGYFGALRNGAVRKEMLLFLAVFLGILLPYATWHEPFGGISFGPRFLVAAIPFLLLPAGYAIERTGGWKTGLSYAAYLAGVVMNGMAGVEGAIPVTRGFDDSPFLSVVLPGFLRGNLDTSWGFGSDYAMLLGVLLVLSLGVIVPVAIVEAAKRKEILN